MRRAASRWLVRGLLAAAVLLGVLTLLLGPKLLRMADVGAGYAAKAVCSCVFVGERPFEACSADLPAEFERVTVEPLPDGARASLLFGWIERRALHDPDTGCALQP